MLWFDTVRITWFNMLIFISSFLIEHEVRNNLVFFKVVEQSSRVSKQAHGRVFSPIPLLSVPDKWNIMVCIIANQVRESVFYIHKDGWSMCVVTSIFFWNIAVIYFIKYFFEVKFERKDPPETWSRFKWCFIVISEINMSGL